MPILELDHITKSYARGGFFSRSQTVPVLRGVDLVINTGDCVGLIGRSGCGKSTLGRLLLGLEAPDQGEVRILERRTCDSRGRIRLDRKQRRAVQVVFQDAIGSVNPRFTAGRIISEPLRNFEHLGGQALKMRVNELLIQVGLDPQDADKYPARFSGGQLQRISIARALAARPQCIILDEAVSSLDMLVQTQILNLLDDLRRRRGVAYLFITHDLRLLRRFCDRALILDQGRLFPFDHRRLDHQSGPQALQDLVAAMLPAFPAEMAGGAHPQAAVRPKTRANRC